MPDRTQSEEYNTDRAMYPAACILSTDRPERSEQENIALYYETLNAMRHNDAIGGVKEALGFYQGQQERSMVLVEGPDAEAFLRTVHQAACEADRDSVLMIAPGSERLAAIVNLDGSRVTVLGRFLHSYRKPEGLTAWTKVGLTYYWTEVQP